MARSSRSGPTPVDAIKHSDKRTNIPTADAHAFVDPAIEEVRKARYARDESLDPQLVWRGKYPAADAPDGEEPDLITDAPPIYIQEKIDPRVLIENLRRTAARPEEEPELALFDSFDGLEELDQVDFYKHEANWSNRMILGDSLQVMASLAEREKLRGKVQMIYIDPPYGIKFGSNWQVSARNRTVRDGKLEDAPREVEQIKAFRDTWEFGIHSYLSHLRDRLVLIRELLSESGSCFVQIGDENVHLVRSLLDEVFGSTNFVSQITYKTTTGATADVLAGVQDFVLWYAKDRERLKWRPLYAARAVDDDANYRLVREGDAVRALTKEEFRAKGELFSEGWDICRANPLTSQTVRIGQTTVFPVEVEGYAAFTPGKGGWKTNREGMERLRLAGRLLPTGRTLSFLRPFADFPYQAISNAWDDTRQSGFGAEKTYVVQTATKVVERCVLLSTDPGDLILDPTCGSGTTAFVGEQWGRRWITIDTSRVALALARQRIMGSRYPWYLLADSKEGFNKEQSLRAESLPQREFMNDIRQGFVYDRVRHITLKSIAQNPDLREGMGRQEIEAAIKRHADFEPLYDQPFESSNTVRVSGPFTVESLSPHRSLAFAAGREVESVGEVAAAKDADTPNFEQSILDNLARAGIQNGRRRERITFSVFETYAGEYIQAIGQRSTDDVDAGAPRRIAIAIGPQYGTVSPSFVKKAAREAIHAEEVDLLCILAFAFDAQVTGITEADGVTVEAGDDGFANVAGVRQLGRIPVLMVRMNADLLMGEELKKTGAGNLFTVFGEPDIQIEETASGLAVHLNGVDVYDPTTGEVRSNDTSRIALWMIDSDYNEESFFVRHCYFTGGGDPYKKLRTALKAEIDQSSWDSLYSTISRPFPKPATGKIAVKVINDYGDEVMSVFEV